MDNVKRLKVRNYSFYFGTLVAILLILLGILVQTTSDGGLFSLLGEVFSVEGAKFGERDAVVSGLGSIIFYLAFGIGMLVLLLIALIIYLAKETKKLKSTTDPVDKAGLVIVPGIGIASMVLMIEHPYFEEGHMGFGSILILFTAIMSYLYIALIEIITDPSKDKLKKYGVAEYIFICIGRILLAIAIGVLLSKFTVLADSRTIGRTTVSVSTEPTNENMLFLAALARYSTGEDLTHIFVSIFAFILMIFFFCGAFIIVALSVDYYDKKRRSIKKFVMTIIGLVLLLVGHIFLFGITCGLENFEATGGFIASIILIVVAIILFIIANDFNSKNYNRSLERANEVRQLMSPQEKTEVSKQEAEEDKAAAAARSYRNRFK